MGRNVRGHANRNTCRTINKQVREASRQNRGFGERLVVVGLEINRLFVEVAQQLHGRLVEACLGVTHGCSAVTIDRAEVAVAVNQRNAHVERLGQAHHGVVDSCVAMRVVLADDVADRTGGLHMRTVGRVTRLVHGIEDAAVNRLQAVAHVGKSARHDDAHRVLEERRLHLFAQVGGAHDRAFATVGVFYDFAMGRRHVDHERLSLHLFGNDGARKRASFEAVFFVKLFVFSFEIFLGPVEEFVEGIVALVIVCHVMLLRCRMRGERDAPSPLFLKCPRT